MTDPVARHARLESLSRERPRAGGRGRGMLRAVHALDAVDQFLPA